MGKIDIEKCKEEASRYTLTTNSLNELIDNLKKSLVENSNFITDANKVDVKVNKKQIKIKKLIEIIDSYRETECVLNSDERKIVIYKGDPYITLHICMQAITQRTKVLLLHEEFMVGVNKVLLSIIEKVLKAYNIENLIDEAIDYSLKDIKSLKETYDEVVVIGNTTMYQILEKKKYKVKYFPYNNIALYCEEHELSKLQEAIYIYANENQFEIEILYDTSIRSVIDRINNDRFKNVAILLTKSNENKMMFEKDIKGKDVYVNDNPFKEESGKTYNFLG